MKPCPLLSSEDYISSTYYHTRVIDNIPPLSWAQLYNVTVHGIPLSRKASDRCLIYVPANSRINKQYLHPSTRARPQRHTPDRSLVRAPVKSHVSFRLRRQIRQKLATDPPRRSRGPIKRRRRDRMMAQSCMAAGARWRFPGA